MKTVANVRIDKWLWAVRAFKTRSVANDACNAGRVKIGGKSVKPARSVKIGETVKIQKGQEKKILKVVQLIDKRVGAPLAVTCYEDLSPPPPPRIGSGKLDPIFYNVPIPVARRKPGTGRPTKRERRDLDKFIEEDLK